MRRLNRVGAFDRNIDARSCTCPSPIGHSAVLQSFRTPRLESVVSVASVPCFFRSRSCSWHALHVGGFWLDFFHWLFENSDFFLGTLQYTHSFTLPPTFPMLRYTSMSCPCSSITRSSTGAPPAPSNLPPNRRRTTAVVPSS